MDRMTVSVCIAAYNGEKFIEQQLETILEQSKTPDEVIVCDDGSTDSTAEIVRGFIRQHQLERKFQDNKKANRQLLKGWQNDEEKAMEKQAKSKVFKVLIHNHQWAVFTTRGCGNGYPQSMWIPVTQTEKSRKTEILKSLFCTTNHGADPNRNMWVLNRQYVMASHL